MFIENLETRRFLTVTLQPPTPPGPSGDPGTGTPQYVKVTQDGGGKVTINTTGGSKAVLNVAVMEDGSGNLVVTEIQTGATWTVTGTTALNIQGTKQDDSIFYSGQSIGANITGGSGNDSITVADAGTGTSSIDGGKGSDSINLLVGNMTKVNGGDGADVIYINSGGGIYNVAAGDAIVNAGNGNDIIIIYDGTNSVNGGGGTDTVVAMGGTNSYSSVESVQ